MSSSFVVTDPRAPRRVVDPGIRDRAQNLSRAAQARTPRRTGQLAQGWRIEKVSDGRWRVVNGVPYARFVEYGTRHMPAQPMIGPAVMAARR